jgi:hypothetical protein
MKTVFCIWAGTLATALLSIGQTVVERGPHHNVLRSLEAEEINGEVVIHTNEVTQLGTGINYWDDQQNAWTPSSNEIELLESGATFRKGQFKLIFAANINDANGNLEWFPTPMERIVIQTVGLAMREIATGNAVFIAQIKDTQGFLTAANEITYPQCFDNIDADVRISVNAFGSGFENDVILHERAPDPAVYGFQGECRIEVWHEILSGAQPQLQNGAIARASGVVDTDAQLRFSNMTIGPGTAFLIGANADELRGPSGIPAQVGKQYFTDPQTQMRFLVESVPLTEVGAHLQQLPPKEGAWKIEKADKDRLEAAWRAKTPSPLTSLPQARAASGQALQHLSRPVALNERKPSKEKLMAAITRKEAPPSLGLLLDFSTLIDQTNFTFRGDTTYLVTNSVVNLSGTTVIEPGCVIKFSAYNSGNGTPGININGPLDCQTLPYAPAVLTAADDRTVGETNTASNASVQSTPYGAYHLKFPSSNANAIQLHDIRSRFAQNAFGFHGTGAVEAWNIQVYGAQGNVFEGAGSTVTLRNVLVHNANQIAVPTANNTVFKGEHLTVHSASKTYYAASFTGCSFNLTNSLLVVVTNSSSSGLTTVLTDSVASDVGVFQTVGSGAHYLADNTYRNSGSTGIATNLTQGVFRYSTTHAPITLANNITVDTVLAAQAARDLDAPDKGYHYPALDWAVGNISVATGVTLTLTNGVAVAGFDVNALTLNGTSKLISEGRPHNLNRIVRYNTVQEQPVDWGAVAATMRLINISSANEVRIRLTEGAHLAYAPSSSRINFVAPSGSTLPAAFTIRDSAVYSSKVDVNYSSGGTTVVADVSNNLFHRSPVFFFAGGGTTMGLIANNNLVRYANFSFARQGSGTWTANNNILDHCTTGIGYNSVANSDNAYETGATVMSGSVNSIFITTFDYQTGVQGRWYLPTSGGNLSTLIDNGSGTAANAGLYHYTVRTDHTKDSSTVDVGFHYVAIDTGGPTDGDGDGIPDYLEDRDGDGVADSNELSWTSAVNNSGGLIVFTPLQP